MLFNRFVNRYARPVSAALFAAGWSLAGISHNALRSEDSPSAVASEPQATVSASTTSASNSKPAERLREGTRLTDVTGSFVSVGADSVTFAPAGSKDSYRVLENLALQRISQQLDENRGQRLWVVSGLITEYRGANYLLVTKATVQLQDGDRATAR